jgi:hypothetical protein
LPADADTAPAPPPPRAAWAAAAPGTDSVIGDNYSSPLATIIIPHTGRA